LAYVPLSGPPPLALGLVHSEGAASALTVRAFIDHAREVVTGASLPGLEIGG
jgi:hypothetical protein